jgi:hypothetical protein
LRDWRPDRENPKKPGDQGRKEGPTQIQSHITDAAAPGGKEALVPFVQDSHSQAKGQRPKASPPTGIMQIPLKSPKPQKIEKTIGHSMASFAEKGVEQVHLDWAQEPRPGQQPVQNDPGILCGPQITRK